MYWSEQRINERRQAGPRKNYQQAEDQQEQQNRDQPPFPVLFEKAPQIGEQAPAVRFRCRLLKLGRIWSRHLVLFQVAADILRSPLWQPKTRPARCRFAAEQIPPAPSEQHRDWCYNQVKKRCEKDL